MFHNVEQCFILIIISFTSVRIVISVNEINTLTFVYTKNNYSQLKL